MLCPKCGKESNNVRVCAFCQTPYPIDRSDRAGAPRGGRATSSSKASGLLGDSRNAIMHLSPVKRWGVIGLLAVFTVGTYVMTRERVIPVGVAIPNVIAAPISPGEAASMLKVINAAAKLEERDGELSVQIAAAMFPEQRAGQMALAQRYAGADEIVHGRKRAINFLDPSGSRFARADPAKGVVMTR